MDKTFINIYNNAEGKSSHKTISVTDVVWKIMNGEWKSSIEILRNEPDSKKRDEIKRGLPAVIFAGRCTGIRSDNNLTDYSNLIVIDVDKLSRPQLSSLKKKMANDNYVVLFFESPSFGLKIVFKVSSEKEHHKSHAFKQLQSYFKDNYNIKIDNSGCNISRLCFVSYDPNIYFNESADVFNVDTAIDYDKEEAEHFMSLVQNNPNFEIEYDSEHVFEVAIQWIKKSPVGSYHKGNRNNFIFALSCCLNRAGMDPMMAIALISNRYGSVGLSEVKTTVMSAYKHNSGEHGSKPIYKRKSNQEKLF